MFEPLTPWLGALFYAVIFALLVKGLAWIYGKISRPRTVIYTPPPPNQGRGHGLIEPPPPEPVRRPAPIRSTPPRYQARESANLGGLLDGLFIPPQAAPTPPPDGLPWEVRQACNESRARDEATFAALPQDARNLARLKNEAYDAFYLRQGKGHK